MILYKKICIHLILANKLKLFQFKMPSYIEIRFNNMNKCKMCMPYIVYGVYYGAQTKDVY